LFVRSASAPALPPVLGDRVQLQQVIISLVMNMELLATHGATFHFALPAMR